MSKMDKLREIANGTNSDKNVAPRSSKMDKLREIAAGNTVAETPITAKPSNALKIDPLDEDALRMNVAANRTGPTAAMKAASFVGKNLYNNIVKPIGQGIDKVYERLDDYNFGEKALNDAHAINTSQSQNAWDEDLLRTQRLINDRNELLNYMTPEQQMQYERVPENKKKDYLDTVMGELQQKKGEKRVSDILEMEDKGNQTAQIMALSLGSGGNRFKSGLKGAYNLMRGADETVARDSSEYAFERLRPELNGAMGVAADVLHTVGNMAPSMAIGAITAPLGGAGLGNLAMGVSSAGGGYDQAIGEGYSVDQAAAYGVASGIKEAALQYIIGALPGVSGAEGAVTRFLGKYSDDVLAKIISNPATRKAVTTVIGNALSEGAEEGTQEILDVLLRNAIFGEDNDIDWGKVGYSTGLGALTGGAFAVPGGVNTLVNRDSNINTDPNTLVNNDADIDTTPNKATDTQNDVENKDGNISLNTEDLANYLKVGTREHVRNAKVKMLKEGKSIILTTFDQIKSFINNSVSGKTKNEIVAYGKVGKRLADDIYNFKRLSGTDVNGYYLELDSNRLAHLSEHIKDDDNRNVPLSDNEVLNLTNIIDNYDEIVDVVSRKDGSLRVHLSKKTIDGSIIIVELVSKGRSSLQPVTAWKNTEEHLSKGKTQKKVDTSATPEMTEASAIGGQDTGASTNIISSNAQNSNKINDGKQFSFNDELELNKKSKEYIYQDIVTNFKEITGISRFKNAKELRNEINTFAEDSSKNYGIDKTQIESIFDKMWDSTDDIVPISYDAAKAEFMSSLDKFEQGIEDVIRYNNSKEAAADAREAVTAERAGKAERILSDRTYAKDFFKDFTKARRAYDKLARKEMLTIDDTNIMKQLSEGIVTWEEVERRSGEFNLDAIKRVYDAFNAKHEFEKIERQLRGRVVGENRALAEGLIKGSDNWKDKPMGAMYSREIMERNIEDITRKGNGKNRRNEEAAAINKAYFKPVHENEAKSNRMKAELVEKVKGMNLGTKKRYTVMFENEYTGLPVQAEVSESGLVQLYGEGLIDDSTLDRVGADKEKIKNAVKEFRGIYDQLIDMANDTLIRNGYRPVEYRKDYFPHFTEDKADSTLSKIAGYFGINIKADELPTDIAGITHTFRPGKRWVGNFLERKTNVTDYDALKGFDRYLNGAADVIFHTDDIQRLRAFESELRYKYSDEGTKARIKEIENSTTLTAEQKNSLIEDIMKANEVSHLPNLVTELRNYTDNLAGKKSMSDRHWEQAMGRSLYNFMKKMENRVSANMVALNPGSWLTNFIPITQVGGIVEYKNLARAIWDASKAKTNDDGFSNRSDFLVNRKGSEMTFRTTTDKIQDILTKPFGMIDSFSADVVTRALYYDKMAEVENEAEALEYANDMAARVMADRSKGAKPTVFNAQNPLTKLFTMFQVEVNNQYSYLFKDVPADQRKYGLRGIAMALFEMFAGAYLYNEVYEKFIGRRAALDPIDIVATAWVDFANPDTKKSQAIANTATNIAEEIPFFGGLIGGGRVPISSALPSASKVTEAATGLVTGEMNGKKAAQQLGKELIKPAAYLMPPVGGGQIKKAIEGISTVARGGEYTYDSNGDARLRYAIEDPDVWDYLKAGLFGKSALAEAQQYYEDGMPTLSVKQTQNYHKAVEAGINYKQYMAALRSVKGLESDKDKDGKTITLSLAKKKKAAIDEAVKEFNLTKKQKEILYEANDVSEKVW